MPRTKPTVSDLIPMLYPMNHCIFCTAGVPMSEFKETQVWLDSDWMNDFDPEEEDPLADILDCEVWQLDYDQEEKACLVYYLVKKS